jgi:hypothetical protein
MAVAMTNAVRRKQPQPVSLLIGHAGVAGLGMGIAVRRTAKLSRRVIDMAIVAGMADYRQDDAVEYVHYRFILDATDEIALVSDDDRQISMAATLRRNAIGLWRSEENDPVIRERMEAMARAAENLLVEAGFEFEWQDGYTIYYDREA